MSSTAEHNALVALCRQQFGKHPHVRLWLNSKVVRVNGEARAKPGLGKGTADIIAIGRGGQFCGWECKTGNAVQTPEQRLFATWVSQMGGDVAVFHSVEEFAKLVDAVAERGKVLVALWAAVGRVGMQRVIEALETLT